MPADDDELQTVAERPGWTVAGEVATYQPNPGGWRARVQLVPVPGHRYSRWHIAVINPAGFAAFTKSATTLSYAVTLAERYVDHA